MSEEYNIVIVGAGPAGLAAATTASKYTDKILIVDENIKPGGQLSKQTHKFFGSKNHYASVRGVNICNILLDGLSKEKVCFRPETSAIGFYKPDTLIIQDKEGLHKIKGNKFIFATGAIENMVSFENNDLPGVYGAGAMQTLMNLYGVKPAEKVLMLGAGNIGLIVSYQLMQAGVEIMGVVEASPFIGGYHVHAAKLRRMGVPILTSHTVKGVYGDGKVEKAIIHKLGGGFEPLHGTEKTIEIDTLCLAVGLTPSVELLHQAGCNIKFIKELSGYVSVHDDMMETNIPGVFVAGDASGVEEASAAMLEGNMAGLKAAYDIEGFNRSVFLNEKEIVEFELKSLRTGPFGERAQAGKKRLMVEER